jgi:hypothetical protein
MAGRNVVASLIMEVGANLAGFESDLGRAEKLAAKHTKQMQAMFSKSAALIGGAVAAGAVALTAMIKKSIDAADKLNLMSQRTGVAVEKLSALSYIARMSDVQIDSLQKSVVKLNQKMAAAAGGNEKANATFKALGINVRDASGKLRDSDAVMGDVAEKLSGMRDGAAKTALAVQIFGKSGADLIPVLNGGKEGLRQMTAEAEKMGLIISSKTAAAADLFNDSMDKSRFLVEGFANKVTEKLLPGLAEMADRWVTAQIESGNFAKAGEWVGEALKKIVTGLTIAKNAIDLLWAGIKFIGQNAIAYFQATGKAIGVFAGYVVEAAKAISNPFDENTLAGAKEHLLEEFAAIQKEFKDKAIENSKGVKEAYQQSVQDVADVFESMGDAVEVNTDTLKKHSEVVVEDAAAMKKAAAEAEKIAERHANFREELNALRAELDGPLAKAYNEYNKNIAKLQKDLDDHVITVDEATEAQMLYGEQLKRTRKEIEATLSPAQQMIQDLQFELDLIGKSNIEREKMIALRQAGADATVAEQKQIEKLITSIELRNAADEAAQAYRAAWTNAIDDVSSAFTDWIAGGISSFDDFADELKQIAKGLLRDLINMFIKNKIAVYFTNGGAGGGAGGGWGQLLSSFMGGGSGGGGGGGWGSFTGAGAGGAGAGGGGTGVGGGGGMQYAPYAGAAIGAYTGWQMHEGQSTGTRLAAGLAYGYAGYALGTVALGAYTGAALAGAAAAGTGAAATGVAVGGATAGAAGAAAAIPIVGWVIAAIAAVDYLSGGRVFGTDYRPESSQQTIGIKDDKPLASFTVDEWRYENKKLFSRPFSLGERRERTRNLDVPREMQDAADSFFKEIQKTMEMAAKSLDFEGVVNMIDAEFTTIQKYTKKGKPKGDPTTEAIINGRKYEGISFEDFQKRSHAESIIAVIDAAMPDPVAVAQPVVDMLTEVEEIIREDSGRLRDGTITRGTGPSNLNTEGGAVLGGEASRIAERWRSDAQMLLDGAGFLLAAATDMQRGMGLLLDEGSLTEVANLVEDLSYSGEKLADAYTRIKNSVGLLDQALLQMGATLDMARVDYVLFANDIVEAAGGLERATALWNSFFEGFYSAEETARMNLGVTQTNAARELEDIGLAPDMNMEQFRILFEQKLPELSAEAIVEWLEAANAIRGVISAEQQLTNLRQAQRMQAADYAEFLSDLDNLADDTFMASEFRQDLESIRDNAQQTTRQLYEMARAMGRAAPSAEELARVANISAAEFARAVQRLKGRVGELVSQLYGGGGGGLEAIEEQIRLIEEAQSSAGESTGEIMELNRERYEQEIQYLKDLKEYTDSLLLSDLSPLGPAQRFLEAQSRYTETLAKAQAGDVDALGQLRGVEDQYLRESSGFFGISSADYQRIFEGIMSANRGLIERGPLTQVTTSGGGGGGGVTVMVPSQELIALYEERDRLLLEQERQERLGLATALLQQLGDLVDATGQSIFEIAQEFGFDLKDLVADLGIDVTDLTVETTQEMANLARTLGVSLDQLAGDVGMAIGNIANEQSLLNDAFEAELRELPSGIRDQIGPLLEAVENATNKADANAALEALRAAVGSLDSEFADVLAPYLGLDQSEDDPLITAINESGEGLFTLTEIGNEILGQILNTLRNGSQAKSLTDFDAAAGSAPGGDSGGWVIVPPTNGESKAVTSAAKMMAEVSADSARRIEMSVNKLINSPGRKG